MKLTTKEMLDLIKRDDHPVDPRLPHEQRGKTLLVIAGTYNQYLRWFKSLELNIHPQYGARSRGIEYISQVYDLYQFAPDTVEIMFIGTYQHNMDIYNEAYGRFPDAVRNATYDTD